MDAKRKRIVDEALGFETIPRFTELKKYQPINNRIPGQGKEGQACSYACFGAAVDFDGWAKAFTVEEYTEVVLWSTELSRLIMDARCAVEGRDISQIDFCDFSGGKFASLIKVMERELWRREGVASI